MSKTFFGTLCCLAALGCGSSAVDSETTATAQPDETSGAELTVPEVTLGPTDTYGEYVGQRCAQEADTDRCLVRLLDSRHLDAPELAMLVEAHARLGNEELGALAMERYLTMYPDAPEAEGYRQALESNGAVVATR